MPVALLTICDSYHIYYFCIISHCG